MRVRLIAVGDRMPGWVTTGFAEYAKRLRGEVGLELVEVAAARRGRSGTADRWKAEESTRLQEQVRTGSIVIALDEHGRCESTERFARRLGEWMDQGRDLSLLVGGPDGLSGSLLERCDWRWSLSALTFPHPLVRILVAEQLYRALSLLRNHPYHRG